MKFVGNGVVAAAAPGMATEDALDGEIEAGKRAVTLDGFDCVGGTGGGKTAGRGCQRRNATAVEIDGEQQNPAKDFAEKRKGGTEERKKGTEESVGGTG